MKKIIATTTLAALTALGAPAAAQSPESGATAETFGREGRIAFADRNGIRDWDVEDNDTLLVESRGGDWYRAELMGPCLGLRFSNSIGFESNPDGSFDRFGSIVTENDVCPLRSFVTIPDPEAAPAEEG